MEPAASPAIPRDTDRVLALRARVERHLLSQGFQVHNGKLLTPVIDGKDHLRALHEPAVMEQRDRAKATLAPLEDTLIAQLAGSNPLDPSCIAPYLVQVDDKRSLDAKLWRWCSLHWSIPTSAGYGRRLRFLVRDANNQNAVMGIIGLGDPVFALAARDRWIGWTAEARAERLSLVMDAYTLGAVPPYSNLLGGKLVALLATSTAVQEAFTGKYRDRASLIRNRRTQGGLALLTTTSALGRSSIYNRLRLRGGDTAYVPLGYTSGTGDFHFSGPIYRELLDFARSLQSDPASSHRHEKWGTGFRNRREVIQRALYALGFDGYAMRAHGIRRQVFGVPLLHNSAAFLRGDEPAGKRLALTPSELSDWWKERWATPRHQGPENSSQFDRETWRLWT
jgi:hypothetical protein